MALPSAPLEVIVPIVSVTPETGRVHELWGTAFFIRPNVLMSAKHVLGVAVTGSHRLAAVHQKDEARTVVLDEVYADPHFDIALARVDDWPGEVTLAIAADDTLHMNRDVLTTEYSATQQRVAMESGDIAMNIAANWHKGHIVREYLADLGHQRPTRCVDLSYPAFRGASGAPVVREDSGDVVALIVANVERHLLPAHLERIERPGELVQEVRYFMPHAQAIRASHLRATVEAGLPVLGI